MSAEVLSPIQAFRFELTFQQQPLPHGQGSAGAVSVCQGSFSECSGLEATMEPKVIAEGGRNYGAAQRVGRVTFGTVVLKRGITSNRDLWNWFKLVSGGVSAYRLTAILQINGPAGGAKTQGPPQLNWRWQLLQCMPIKFRVPTANATSNEVAIEELHLAHEGISLIS